MTVNPKFNDATLREVRRLECELDGLYFIRYFLKQRTGSKMIIGRHHRLIQDALDRTMLPPSHPDFISRLIINVPPGYTKTEIASIHYMARGLALDSKNRFLHLSYSSDLALQNSATTRDIVKSIEFQAMWPVATKDDMNSKKTWWTEETGGIRAASARGQVTGFRAGHMDNDRFTGALIIDDPVKPEDATSEVKRAAVNDGYNETIASRLAVETVPIIVIMQRIHYEDLSGHLLRGGSGENWHHLNLPVIIDNDSKYPEENTHGIPIEHNLEDGWLWPYKHNEQHESALRAHRRKWNGQYLQSPDKRDSESVLWTDAEISKTRGKRYSDEVRTLVSIDPAVSNTTTSDEHGIIVGASTRGSRYNIYADYTCKGSPNTWAKRAIAAYEKHEADAIVIEINQGGDMCEDTLRNAGFTGRVLRVRASKGKVVRAEPIAALYELGYIWHNSGLMKLENEMIDFDTLTGLSNGKSPNRVDALVWLLTELSGQGLEFERLLSMAVGE
jgi:phage terminase large subunit-like protein